MIGRQAAAARTVEVDGSLDALGQLPQRRGGIAPPDGSAGHDHRALRCCEQFRSARHMPWFGRSAPAGMVMRRLTWIEILLGIDKIIQYIHRNFQERRPWFAAQHLTKSDGNVFSDARSLMHRARPLRNREQ